MVDLWDKALKNKNSDINTIGSNAGNDVGNMKKATNDSNFHLIIMGSKKCGKSTLIQKFLDKDDSIKPTVALEYKFCRRSKSHSIFKDVGHIWELGGGTFLTQLIDIPVTAENLEHTCAIIMIDLSKPHELWNTFETLSSSLQKRISQASKENPQLLDSLHKKQMQKFQSNPDISRLKLSPIPIAIIGCKFDQFQSLDANQRKLISKTLRFLAHYNGASLMMESLVTKTKHLLAAMLFDNGDNLSKSLVETDYTKPLFIIAGSDNFTDIGSPAGENPSRAIKDCWKDTFCEMFPQKDISKAANYDPLKDEQYKENEIDQIRKQKEQELLKYKKRVN